ncbi:MAG: hypothetical protein IT449_07355, partial [Phycisphaerales bacterium]|nr:hypothetical protein [Phycisphaerales bacterium]
PIIDSESYFGDYDGDGDVDATDDAALGSGQTCWGSNPSGACRVFDFNSDGTLDSADETVMTALVSAPTTNHIHHARRTSPVGNMFLHQGLVYDAEIGAYQNRAREYDASLERFLQRDPLEAPEGLTTYSYVGASPPVFLDPQGLTTVPIDFMLCAALTMECMRECGAMWGNSHPDNLKDCNARCAATYCAHSPTGPPPFPGGGPFGPSWPPGVGNCWRFACNDPRKPGEDPKANPPGVPPHGKITCAQIEAGLASKGIKRKPAGGCPDGSDEVSVWIDDSGSGDYHFYRRIPESGR